CEFKVTTTVSSCGSGAIALLPARSLVRKALYVAFGSVRQYERTGGREPLVAPRTYSKIPGRARSAGTFPAATCAVEPAACPRSRSASPQAAAGAPGSVGAPPSRRPAAAAHAPPASAAGPPPPRTPSARPPTHPPPPRRAAPRPAAPPAPAPRPIARPAAEPTLAERVAAAPRQAPAIAPANANLSDLPEAERLHRIKAAVHDRIIGELGERANELDRDAISQ